MERRLPTCSKCRTDLPQRHNKRSSPNSVSVESPTSKRSSYFISQPSSTVSLLSPSSDFSLRNILAISRLPVSSQIKSPFSSGSISSETDAIQNTNVEPPQPQSGAPSLSIYPMPFLSLLGPETPRALVESLECFLQN